MELSGDLDFAFEISNLLPLQESDDPYINPSLGAQLYDLNQDGYEDVFIGQSGQHMDVEGSEANTLLLSHGNSGKLYP